MAFYHDLKKYPDDKADWIANRILKLRRKLSDEITAKRRAGSLVVGSWNIRAFDGGRPRLDESYHYIAEIIDKFDICAIQEVKNDLNPLHRLVRLLGPNWTYFVNDVTSGKPGNSERMAFVYNKNRVRFRHVIGELVFEKSKLVDGEQIARTPFFASFQAGWFKFTLCSAHIAFKGRGNLSSTELRTKEISLIANALSKRARDTGEVFFFLGDMNIDKRTDPTMKALENAGFTAPLFGPTNMAGSKHFDQLAYTGEGQRTEIISFGCFDWRSAVFGPEDQADYEAVATEQRGEAYANWNKSYGAWTTHEMSDHLPIWVELMVDYSDDYLGRFLAPS